MKRQFKALIKVCVLIKIDNVEQLTTSITVRPFPLPPTSSHGRQASLTGNFLTASRVSVAVRQSPEPEE